MGLQLHSCVVISFWTGFYLVLHFGKGMMVKRDSAFDGVLVMGCAWVVRARVVRLGTTSVNLFSQI